MFDEFNRFMGYLKSIEDRKRFFGSPTAPRKKYREPIRAVNYKARSTIRQHGNRRRCEG